MIYFTGLKIQMAPSFGCLMLGLSWDPKPRESFSFGLLQVQLPLEEEDSFSDELSFCLRDHEHRKLVGWSRIHKACWTRVAQTYPNILCKWISLALLIDAGLRPDRKHINLASICGTIGRIGEASKPGPRYPRQSSRPVHLLDNATLVEAGTELIGSRVWERFRAWSLRSLRVSTFEQLVV